MEPSTKSSWDHYHARARLDAFLASATALLRDLDDEESIADLEMLRRRNVANMSRIQNAAYQDCSTALDNNQ